MRYNSDIHHRRSIRLKAYDYSQTGLYFVTICTRNREHLFGEICDGKMVLNAYGRIAYDEWLKTANIRCNVQLDKFVVMPNHIHGIIAITDKIASPRRGVLHTPHIPDTPLAGNCDQMVIGGVCNTPLQHPKTIEHDTIANGGVCNTPLRSPSQTVGAIIRGYKTAVTKQLNKFECFGTIWQRNYHEHIIRTNRSYQYIANYIITNPANWDNDTLNAPL